MTAGSVTSEARAFGSHGDGLAGPVMIVGSTGMLGRAWVALLRGRGIEHVLTTRAEVDLRDPGSIERTVNGRCRWVVNCAAWTDVDGAEKDFAGAVALNATGVEALARRCKKVGATLVHYSTDYVFNGQATRPYPTDHPREPLNAYGKSKAMGEEAIERSGCRYLILRTSWLYAPWGKNFVRTIAGLLRQRDSIKVVDDQRGRPTSCEPLAETSLKLMTKDAEGMYHATDGGECTWYGLAREVGRLLGTKCRVDPCTTAEFPRPAKRPAYSVLDLSQTERLIGPMTPWEVTLADVVKRLEVG